MRRLGHLLTLSALLFSALPVPSAAEQGSGVSGAKVEDRPGGLGGPGPTVRGPERPAPRSADGKILLGGAGPGGKGVWLPAPGITAVPIKPAAEVPFHPWARALFAERQRHELEPHTRCKPSGVARQFQTPYGVEFVELPELQRIYIFDVGGPHTYRTVYMDGRTHPRRVTPDAYGHSIGWWDGDTLVVESTGFHEGFWFERRGLPHTEELRTLERFTRLDFNTLKYDVTVDDPGAYTERWTTSVNLRWEEGTELFEYICQQANYMIGQYEASGTTIVP